MCHSLRQIIDNEICLVIFIDHHFFVAIDTSVIIRDGSLLSRGKSAIGAACNAAARHV